MKHYIALTAVLFASFTAPAQTVPEDSLALELERALSALDTSLVNALPEQFSGALFRLIAASLDEAAKELDDATNELNLEVASNPSSRGITLVSGTQDSELVPGNKEMLLIRDQDTLVLDDLAKELEDKPRDPRNRGYWKGWGVGTALLTTRPDARSLEGMELLDSPMGLQTSNALSSWNIQINSYEYRQPLIGDAVGLTTGLGFDWWRFNVSPQTVLTRAENGSVILATDSLNQIHRNHLTLTYARIPLLLSLRTSSNPEEALHLECGIVGGVRLHNQYVRKYSDAESRYEDKVKGFGMNPLQLNARFVAGYGGFSVFAEVPLRPLWDEPASSSNPLIHPVSLGVKFTDFD